PWVRPRSTIVAPNPPTRRSRSRPPHRTARSSPCHSPSTSSGATGSSRSGRDEQVVSSRTMPVKVSVVVPVYNPGRYLDPCAKSLLDQSLPRDEYEIIFVDDGSS